MAIVKGVWVLNETLDMSNFASIQLGVDREGYPYGLEAFPQKIGDPLSLFYYNYEWESEFQKEYIDFAIYDGSTNKWLYEDFRTYNFGKDGKEISEDSYAWLMENALPQGAIAYELTFDLNNGQKIKAGRIVIPPSETSGTYSLTEEDKADIADIVLSKFIDVSEVGQ
jgi:hypothetical protein